MDLNVAQNGALPLRTDVPRRSSRGGRIFLHLMLAVLGALLGAGFAYRLGQDICFDQLNYHAYSAYALWMNRYSRDIAPGQIFHSFFNPVIYLPFYLMMKHLTPVMTGTILGAIHGINLWLVAVIAWIATPALVDGTASHSRRSACRFGGQPNGDLGNRYNICRPAHEPSGPGRLGAAHARRISIRPHNVDINMDQPRGRIGQRRGQPEIDQRIVCNWALSARRQSDGGIGASASRQLWRLALGDVSASPRSAGGIFACGACSTIRSSRITMPFFTRPIIRARLQYLTRAICHMAPWKR